MDDERLHVASTDISAPVARVFAFMADAHQLARWATGLADQQVITPSLVQGRLLATGQVHYCELAPAPEPGVVVYRLGSDRHALIPRISALVVDAQPLGYAHARLTLLAWRTADMDDARWQALGVGHEAEVGQIKRMIEGLPL